MKITLKEIVAALLHQIPGTNEEAYRKIRQAEDEIRNKPREWGIIFDTDGEVLMPPKPGERDEIFFTEQEIRSMRGKIVTHNHRDSSPPSYKEFTGHG